MDGRGSAAMNGSSAAMNYLVKHWTAFYLKIFKEYDTNPIKFLRSADDLMDGFFWENSK